MNKALKNKEKIAFWLEKHPGSKTTEIARELGMTRVTIYSHLRNLVSDGRVRILGLSTATRYFPVDRALQTQEILPEIQKLLYEKYEEVVSTEEILDTFRQYMMYIDDNGIISYGLDAFILWCHDSRHDYGNIIPEKAVEYIDLIGSTEYLRGKNGFLDVTIPARENLGEDMKTGFDRFFICMVSVLSHGFGSVRTALSLRYGKKNSNSELLRDAVNPWIRPIRDFVDKHRIDAVVFTPPTEGRKIQFRDILEQELHLTIEKIIVEKLPLSGRVLEAQKNIRDKKRRINNALGSMVVSIPSNLLALSHILVLDDSFTTGATPNAIALKLREAGYKGKITIITICGSFNYDLAITEDEI